MPDEEWLARLDGAIDIVQGCGQKLVIGGFHTLLCKRAGVFAHLLAPGSEAGIGGRGIIRRGGFALEDATWSELRPEAGVLGVVDILRLFFRIQVIEVAKELVETVYRGQEFIAIAKMVLAILEGHVTERLQQFGQRRVFFVQSNRRAWQPDF